MVHSRPVELAKLLQTKFDIARPVLKESLAHRRDAVWDILNRSKLKGGNVRGNHDGKGCGANWKVAAERFLGGDERGAELYRALY
jgi:hypothetical protein